MLVGFMMVVKYFVCLLFSSGRKLSDLENHLAQSSLTPPPPSHNQGGLLLLHTLGRVVEKGGRSLYSLLLCTLSSDNDHDISYNFPYTFSTAAVHVTLKMIITDGKCSGAGYCVGHFQWL